MSDKELNEKGSLAIISSMIDEVTHKGKIVSHGKYFQIYGWSGFIAGVVQFIMLKAGFGSHYVVWLLAMIVSILTTTVWAEGKNISDTRYFGKLINAVYQGFVASVSFVFLLLQNANIHQAWSFAFVIMLILLAFSAWIIGEVFQFKMFKYGAFATWGLSFATIYIPISFVPLVISLGILLSVIIPGYLLSKSHGKKA
jgi:hypothetical protein